MQPMAPVPLQLMVFLKYLGTEGTDGLYSKIGNFLCILVRSVMNYLNQSTNAFLEMWKDIINWPNTIERQLISTCMETKYGFNGCVGMVNGTLSPLESKPTCNGHKYYTRKSLYAVNVLIFVNITA